AIAKHRVVEGPGVLGEQHGEEDGDEPERDSRPCQLPLDELLNPRREPALLEVRVSEAHEVRPVAVPGPPVATASPARMPGNNSVVPRVGAVEVEPVRRWELEGVLEGQAVESSQLPVDDTHDPTLGHQKVPHPEVAVYSNPRKPRPLKGECQARQGLEELLLHAAPADLSPVPRTDAIDAGVDRHAVDDHLIVRCLPLEPLQPSLCRLEVAGDATGVTRMAWRVVPGGHRLPWDRRLDEHEVTIHALQRDG